MEGFAKAEVDEKVVEKRLLEYMSHIPMAARSFGIRIENNIPNVEDIARVAKERLFIGIKPSLAEI